MPAKLMSDEINVGYDGKLQPYLPHGAVSGFKGHVRRSLLLSLYQALHFFNELGCLDLQSRSEATETVVIE